MLYRKTYVYTILIVLAIAFLSGCYKNKVVNLMGETEVTRTVTFAADVIPIFNSSCNMSGCHSAGGISPNLSPANAYNSLSSGGYLTVNNPKESELYLWMAGKKGTPMPLSGPNSEFNSLILAWIRQGGLNN